MRYTPLKFGGFRGVSGGPSKVLLMKNFHL